MSAKKILVMGVGYSGVSSVYELLQKILEERFSGDIDYVYEPFLWDRGAFNKLYSEIGPERTLATSISLDGLFFHSKIPLLYTEPEPEPKEEPELSLKQRIKANLIEFLDDSGKEQAEEEIEEEEPLEVAGISPESQEFMMNLLAPLSNKQHWLAAMTGSNGRIEIIRQLDPELKILFLIRNPLDVISSAISGESLFGDGLYNYNFDDFYSLVKEHFSAEQWSKFSIETDEEKEYLYWYFMNKAALESFVENSTNIMPLVYEDLLENKAECLSELCDFIGLESSSHYQEYINIDSDKIAYHRPNLTPAGFEYITQFKPDYNELISGFNCKAPDLFIEKSITTSDGYLSRESASRDFDGINTFYAREQLEQAKTQLLEYSQQKTIAHNYAKKLEDIVATSAKPPRILIISSTPIGSDSATGILMENLFKGHYDNILQIYTRPKIERNLVRSFELLERHEQYDIQGIVAAYNPDIIYFRPAEDPWFFCQKVFRFMLTVKIPYVCHIMDDWIMRVDEEKAQWLDNKFKPVLKNSAMNFTISKKMSDAYEKRYFIKCHDIANYFDFEQDKEAENSPSPDNNRPLKMLYCGGLSDDMNFTTIKNLTEAVKKYAPEEICFDLHIPEWHQEKAATLKHGKQIKVLNYVDKSDYYTLLSSADILIVAYNFDPRSVDYCRHSMANKLPDLVSVIKPILSIGSPEIATLEFVREHNIGHFVDEDGVYPLELAIKAMTADYEKYLTRAALNFKNLKNYYSKKRVMSDFQNTLFSSTHSNTYLYKNKQD